VLIILLAQPHALWIDNYNKGYQQLMLNLEVGSFHCINSTSLVLVLLNMEFCSGEVPGTAQITPKVLSCTHLSKFVSVILKTMRTATSYHAA
jgi:hypothetical protein